jgi:SAM-dependent methyltransferase
MDWVRDFYSTTGRWWGPAESRITDRDHRRVAELHQQTGRATPMRVLELGSGYGTTAAALADAGHAVTAVEISDRLAYRVPHDGPGTVEAVDDDFYAVRLTGRFDAVCYYNGFGVGSDADQRRLLKRIADEWLADDGVALIDVSTRSSGQLWTATRSTGCPTRRAVTPTSFAGARPVAAGRHRPGRHLDRRHRTGPARRPVRVPRRAQATRRFLNTQ